MMLRARQFMALTGLTALEAMRQPLCVLLTASGVVATALIPLLTVFHFGEEGRLARDSGLALHFVIGLIVATYAACSALTREIRDGTAAAVLSKPVDRELFFLAKFAGVCGVVLGFSLCAALSTLLAERVAERFFQSGAESRHIIDTRTGIALAAAPFLAYGLAGLINYRTRRPFQSTAFGLVLLFVAVAFLSAGFFDRESHLGGAFALGVAWRIVPASLLVTLALVLFAALALGLSTRLGAIPTLTVCGILFVLGLISDYEFGRHAAGSLAAGTLYGLLPNWQHFWVSDLLGDGGAVPREYVGRAAGYWAASLAGILLLGTVSFRHTDVN